MSSTNRLYNVGIIGFATSFSSHAMCMLANISTYFTVIYLFVKALIELDRTICCQFAQQLHEYD